MIGRTLSPAARAHFEAACQHYQARRYALAEAGFRAALDEAPSFAMALGNLGETLRALGRFDEAVEVFVCAVRVAPADASIRNSYGAALLEAARRPEAIEQLRAALALDPNNHRALANMGTALLRMGRASEAVEPLERSLALHPDSVPALSSIGVVYTRLRRLAEATAALTRGLRLEPGNAGIRSTLASALWYQGRVDEAMQLHREVLELQPDFADARSAMLFALHHGEGAPPAIVLDEHLRYGAHLQRAVGAPRAAWPNARDPQRRLRVGYVSPDLRAHPVGIFTAPVFAAHDRARVEVFAYGATVEYDAMQARIRAVVDHFVDTRDRSDAWLEARIDHDQIDVLVDLAGHTTDHRLAVFARRPAPVSFTWLGYPDTTGLATIDYRITDAVADPPGPDDAHYTEELLRLPHCFIAYERPREVTPAGAPPSASMGRVTFGSFNGQYKLSPTVARTWAAILLAVPGSRLLLKSVGFDLPGPRARVLAWFAAAGVGPERVEFLPLTHQWEDSLAQYNQVDIALDAFPYNGTTTTCDTLAMGVPLVALRGTAHAGRVSASVLTSIGEPSLIAETEADYVRIAVELARDPERLARLRRGLPGRFDASPVGDPTRLARDLEGAYRAAWIRYCESNSRKPPARAPSLLRDDECDHVPIAGGVTVAVPRAVENLTSYVLREQGDWFEDEMSFVRALTLPGDRAIDCGANHGVYTLTLAHLAGPTGRVWAFEPAARTAAFLRMGVARNGLANVTVFEAALSNRSGEGALHQGSASEMSSLTEDVRAHGPAGAVETVAVFSLDDIATPQGLRDVSFCKLDAEGEEQRILEGGLRFFESESPLVMTELRHAGSLNTGLVAAFAARGYAPYRLVPGLGILTAFSDLSAPDAFLLNVFLCKPDRAATLAARGLLVRPDDAAPSLFTEGAWRDALSRMPYAQGLWPQGVPTPALPGADPHGRALDAWFASRDVSLTPAVRLAALTEALAATTQSLEAHASLGRLFTAARIARAMGKREATIALLDEAMRRLGAGQALALDEPFLAPCERFDDVAVKGGAAAWGLAAAVETHECLRAWSSYYTGPSALASLDALERIGYLGAAMARRRAVLRARFALTLPPPVDAP